MSGGYVEAGDTGRFAVAPGDVLVHGPFEAHMDRFGPNGAEVLNLPLLAGIELPPILRLGDPDEIARLAERDGREAAGRVVEVAKAVPACAGDWPDTLAAALRQDPELSLSRWAHDNGLAPASVSRGFAAAYGVGPARYRADVQVRRAWRAIVSTDAPLSIIAAEAGFADQAHMTRGVTAITGAPPGRWRTATSNPFKTGVVSRR